MPNTSTIAFNVIFAFEAIIILVGNTFAIFVFWTRRSNLKRTCFLLINLAVADLLVGDVETIYQAMARVPKLVGKKCSNSKTGTNILSSMQVLASCASVFFLVLVALERVYAVVWPFRHRVTGTKAYLYSMAVAWVAAISMGALYSLQLYDVLDSIYASVAILSSLSLSLVIICGSYLTIRCQLQPTIPAVETHNRKTLEQNLKISRSLFIVTAVSLLCWIPSVTIFAIGEVCAQCLSEHVEWTGMAFHLANSMVNPFVYSFRMPIFKEVLTKCFRKRNSTGIHDREIRENNLNGAKLKSFKPRGDIKVSASADDKNPYRT